MSTRDEATEALSLFFLGMWSDRGPSLRPLTSTDLAVMAGLVREVPYDPGRHARIGHKRAGEPVYQLTEAGRTAVAIAKAALRGGSSGAGSCRHAQGAPARDWTKPQ
ncbi:hypothetical protein [Marinivivus vitaminiproducens]|uniref:hypothetical protein n=1 Tax=Marinivivus vitaminiproducens TaxID=3035935 RepID=UPI0027A5946D|nr:hypothetical protein P4R82_04865 [Geminicoccaceae bacterium SCSIO 64248]